MELVIKSRNAKLSERQQNYIKEKIAKLERYLDSIGKVTVEVAEEQRRAEGNIHRAQVTLLNKNGAMLRAEQRDPDFFAVIDGVQDTLQRQIQRYKDKHYRRGKLRRDSGFVNDTYMENGEASLATAESDIDEDEAPALVRTKEIYAKPMSSEEAVEQMELLGHDFFMFRDSDRNDISVVYRRRDGNYGLLVPVEREK